MNGAVCHLFIQYPTGYFEAGEPASVAVVREPSEEVELTPTADKLGLLETTLCDVLAVDMCLL
jgi:8-oxo-dGTP pyrophosphatase MutT (NUDIX family)